MKRAISIMIISTIILSVICYAIMISDKESDSYDIMIADIKYDKGNISLENFQLAKGFAPDKKHVDKGEYKIEILSNNNVIYETFFDKPSVVLDYSINNTLTGNYIELDQHIFSIILPLKQNADIIRMKDSMNNTLILQDFSWILNNNKEKKSQNIRKER